jgi:hypothetical protein
VDPNALESHLGCRAEEIAAFRLSQRRPLALYRLRERKFVEFEQALIGFSLIPPLFAEGRGGFGGRAILARPQKGPFLLILRVKSPKMRDLRLRPEEVAFKPAKGLKSGL